MSDYGRSLEAQEGLNLRVKAAAAGLAQVEAFLPSEAFKLIAALDVAKGDTTAPEFVAALLKLRGVVLVARRRKSDLERAKAEAAQHEGAMPSARRISPDRMKSVCAGCGKHLGGPLNAPLISHGYCERGQPCWDEAIARRERAASAAKVG